MIRVRTATIALRIAVYAPMCAEMVCVAPARPAKPAPRTAACALGVGMGCVTVPRARPVPTVRPIAARVPTPVGTGCAGPPNTAKTVTPFETHRAVSGGANGGAVKLLQQVAILGSKF